MFHGSRRYTVIMAAISVGLLTAACSSSGGTSGIGTAPGPPAVAPATDPVFPPASVAGKQLHSTKTAQDYGALDRGILTYTPLKTLQVGVPATLNINVIDIGRGPQLASTPIIYHGEAVDPYDVPTSAEVLVQIICTSDLECRSQFPQGYVSQFVSPRQEGYWDWSLDAVSPGIALIGIEAVTYENGSNAFLHATPLWTISLKVGATGD